MGARYVTAAFQTPIAAANKTIVELKGSTDGRIKLYDWLMGASGTPADNALVYVIQRTTGIVGVGAAIVPEALDPADVAAAITVLEDLTTEPTAAGIALVELPVNLRASYRWVAAPNSEIVVAAVANEGLLVAARSAAYTGQAESTVWHEE